MKNFFSLLILGYTFLLSAAEEHFVVGIHGLLGNSSSFCSIERNFRNAHIQIYLWNYPSTEGTICSHGQALYQLLQQIAQARPEQPINFITHSVGAIILRQALNIEGCPEEAKIGRAVLLAPPNQGSRLARNSRGILPVHWALGSQIGCELMTYDPCAIQAIGPFPPTMEVLVIAGCKGSNLLFNEPNDGFLAVTETALETPYYFESFKVNHGNLLTNPMVLKSARNFLLNGSGKKKVADPAPTESASSKEN